MPEIFFFFSADDPSIALESLCLGNSLIVAKHYEPGEQLLVLSSASDADVRSFNRFYILPNERFISEIVLDDVTKNTGEKFLYIMDRVGAAAIDLILYKKPSQNEVCVGSLGYQYRTYRSKGEPLEPRPQVFSEAFQTLYSYIKKSARPVSNSKTPKTVYIFPEAMALLRQDFSRSPWPSVQITD